MRKRNKEPLTIFPGESGVFLKQFGNPDEPIETLCRVGQARSTRSRFDSDDYAEVKMSVVRQWNSMTFSRIKSVHVE